MQPEHLLDRLLEEIIIITKSLCLATDAIHTVSSNVTRLVSNQFVLPKD